MNDREFFQKVAEKAVLSVEEAADLTRATLEILSGRLSSGEARNLARQLPDGLSGYLPEHDRIEKFGLAELLLRVGKRTGLNANETEAGVRAVLTKLAHLVDTQVYQHVMAQLPGEFRTLAGMPA